MHLIAPAHSGGAESSVLELVLALRGRGCDAEITALAPQQHDHPFLVRARRADIPVTLVSLARRRYLAEARAVRHALRARSADVLHTHIYHADMVGFLAAYRRLPLVSTVHGFTGCGLRNEAYIWLDMRILHRFDAIVCVAENVRTRILRERCNPRRVHMIPNGYRGERQLPRSEAQGRLGLTGGRPVVGWVGRMTSEKGADLFIDALASMEYRDVDAIVVGEGPERSSLMARAAAAGIADRVRFTGRRDEIATLLSAFDILALSSRTEATPMIILEAMAASVPIVAFAVGGIPAILDRTAGWLVPPNSVSAFARALDEAVADSAEAGRRADAAASILTTRFNADAWAARLEDVYRSVARRLA